MTVHTLRSFTFLWTLTWMMAGVAPGAEFYVDSFAAPSGDGSRAAPFQTIQAGIDRLTPGDVLYIRGDISGSGTGRVYLETPVFRRSGRDGASITLQSFPGETVIVSTPDTIRLDKDFFHIEGLIFDHQSAPSDAIRWSGDHIHLRECQVRHGSRDGIDVSASSTNATIENCVIVNFIWKNPTRRDAHCIVANPGVRNLRIVKNTIFNCSGDGIHFFATDSTPMSSYVRDAVIKHNTIYSALGRYSENGLDLKGGVRILIEENDIYGFTYNKAVVVQKGARDLSFRGNRIHDSERGAEFRWEGGILQQNIAVTRNVFYNITGQYAVKFDGAMNVKLVHNTFHKSAGAAIRVESAGINTGVIKNNLIHLSRAPRITGTFSADVSHNGWFGSSGGSLASPSDTKGSDPHFVDPSSNDFQLQPTSAAIDKGAPLKEPYQGVAPDLGAFEAEPLNSPAISS
jgi:hypothetical protein